MLKRRQFLTGLAALAGSPLLGAVSAHAAVTASADATAIPGASSITDSLGSIWTVSNGVIFRNGQTVGNTYNVSLLLWYGGKVWHSGTGGQFYVLTGNDTWVQCNDPRVAIPGAVGSFYGMNGHFDYTYTPAQIISMLKALGCTTYRVGCTDDPRQLNAVAALAQAFENAGMTLFVLVNVGLSDSSGNLYPNEEVAYSTARGASQTIASTLSPYGVTIYECGNELTRQNS
ncbi:hypothetical protein M0D69_40100, partial [Caballeronia sp. SEWSISQ10-4 2]|nr:hypothetical protein [Caballeronia sp. SEWSISQ10-4 2]